MCPWLDLFDSWECPRSCSYYRHLTSFFGCCVSFNLPKFISLLASTHDRFKIRPKTCARCAHVQQKYFFHFYLLFTLFSLFLVTSYFLPLVNCLFSACRTPFFLFLFILSFSISFVYRLLPFFFGFFALSLVALFFGAFLGGELCSGVSVLHPRGLIASVQICAVPCVFSSCFLSLFSTEVL